MPRASKKVVEIEPSLSQRIAEAVGTASAPSLVPDYNPPPAKPKEPPPPELKSLVKDTSDYLKLRRLISAALDYRATEKEVKESRRLFALANGAKEVKGGKNDDLLGNLIKDLLGKHGVGKAMVEGDRINYYSGTRSSIKADLLMAQGVTPAQIAAATVTSYTYTLKLAKGEEGEDD